MQIEPYKHTDLSCMSQYAAQSSSIYRSKLHMTRKVGTDPLTAMDETLEEGVDATRSQLPMKIIDVQEKGAMTGLRPPPKMLAAEHWTCRRQRRPER